LAWKLKGGKATFESWGIPRKNEEAVSPEYLDRPVIFPKVRLDVSWVREKKRRRFA